MLSDINEKFFSDFRKNCLGEAAIQTHLGANGNLQKLQRTFKGTLYNNIMTRKTQATPEVKISSISFTFPS